MACDVTQADHVAHRDPAIALIHLRCPKGVLHIDRRFGGRCDTREFEPITIAGEPYDFTAVIGCVARNNIVVFHQKSLEVGRKQPPEHWRGAGDVGFHKNRGSQVSHSKPIFP
jgi:hypothetical protein